ncbi:MAG: hypothetical protein ACRDRH_23210 [Pseudonocardia sp.]
MPAHAVRIPGSWLIPGKAAGFVEFRWGFVIVVGGRVAEDDGALVVTEDDGALVVTEDDGALVVTEGDGALVDPVGWVGDVSGGAGSGGDVCC